MILINSLKDVITSEVLAIGASIFLFVFTTVTLIIQATIKWGINNWMNGITQKIETNQKDITKKIEINQNDLTKKIDDNDLLSQERIKNSNDVIQISFTNFESNAKKNFDSISKQVHGIQEQVANLANSNQEVSYRVSSMGDRIMELAEKSADNYKRLVDKDIELSKKVHECEKMLIRIEAQHENNHNHNK